MRWLEVFPDISFAAFAELMSKEEEKSSHCLSQWRDNSEILSDKVFYFISISQSLNCFSNEISGQVKIKKDSNEIIFTMSASLLLYMDR